MCIAKPVGVIRGMLMPTRFNEQENPIKDARVPRVTFQNEPGSGFDCVGGNHESTKPVNDADENISKMVGSAYMPAQALFAYAGEKLSCSAISLEGEALPLPFVPEIICDSPGPGKSIRHEIEIIFKHSKLSPIEQKYPAKGWDANDPATTSGKSLQVHIEAVRAERKTKSPEPRLSEARDGRIDLIMHSLGLKEQGRKI
jgi:hypothetical protein